MFKKKLFRFFPIVLLGGLLASCQQSIKITPFAWASRKGFIYGADSNKVTWKNDYYFNEYKNLSDKELIDTVKSYFLKHYDSSVSKFNQYDIFFYFRTTGFNEEAIKKQADILNYQLDGLRCSITSFDAGLVSIFLYNNGKVSKDTDFYPPWSAHK